MKQISSERRMLACTSAEPQFITIPFPIDGIDRHREMACMVMLFKEAGMPDNDSCIDLHYLYPHVSLKSKLPPFTEARIDFLFFLFDSV